MPTHCDYLSLGDEYQKSDNFRLTEYDPFPDLLLLLFLTEFCLMVLAKIENILKNWWGKKLDLICSVDTSLYSGPNIFSRCANE